ncbi:unnamed protein product [Effrenium voratum]|uniref:EF-hand domain-containing protein n=1 Tax=Effrenium voratum TaxID=2562239 RepID=A0AA36I2I4_9DINO|nr:unnamed protein product [Effrenium voratum]CAJ1418197.1 unnamed protein product [Effrenium voratum]
MEAEVEAEVEAAEAPRWETSEEEEEIGELFQQRLAEVRKCHEQLLELILSLETCQEVKKSPKAELAAKEAPKETKEKEAKAKRKTKKVKPEEKKRETPETLVEPEKIEEKPSEDLAKTSGRASTRASEPELWQPSALVIGKLQPEAKESEKENQQESEKLLQEKEAAQKQAQEERDAKAKILNKRVKEEIQVFEWKSASKTFRKRPPKEQKKRPAKARSEMAEEDMVGALTGNGEVCLTKRLELARAKHERNQNASLKKRAEQFLKFIFGRGEDDEDVKASELSWLIFETVAAFMILANSFLLGIEAQYLSTQLSSSATLIAFSVLFSVWFMVEVLIRLKALGVHVYFLGEDKAWNLCDVMLVIISIVDISMIASGDASTSLSVLKMVKMLRVVRLFRIFRFFRQLATLAAMVADSVKQLVWALVMFFMVMYVFAISLTSSCTDWLKDQVDYTAKDWRTEAQQSSAPGVRQVYHHFGDVPRSIDTLFETTLGGLSWHELMDALGYVDALSYGLMSCYIIFTVLALLNVFTGVFVDNALQNSKKQRQIQIEETIDKKKENLDQIIEFFVATDLDCDGFVSLDEIQNLLADPVMSAYFDMIGFRPGDASMLAALLDRDGSGEITLREFIAGCERMKGQAKGVDVHIVLTEIEHLVERIAHVEKLLTGQEPPHHDCRQINLL